VFRSCRRPFAQVFGHFHPRLGIARCLLRLVLELLGLAVRFLRGGARGLGGLVGQPP
jgi:hypothetical protein